MAHLERKFLLWGTCVSACATLTFLYALLAPQGVSSGTTSATSLTVGDATSTISAVIINAGSPITLTANATKTVQVSITISDNNGCADVFTGGNVTSTLYRSGVSSTCAVANLGTSAHPLNCYAAVSYANTCVGTSTTGNATATFEVWYFADATDVSSSYSAQAWDAFVLVRSATGATSSATSSSQVELNSLLALDVTSSTNYGTVTQGENTSSTNQTVTAKNAGNSSSSLKLSGTALTSGSNSIATSSQHYATSTFTFGGAEQTLQQTATTVAGFLIPRPPLTSWSSTTALPAARTSHPAVVNNGYVYAIGGFDSSPGPTSSVFFAPINSTGSIGAWSSTTALPAARAEFSAVVNNGYVYAIGGQVSGSAITSSVLFAPINSTGSIGAWSSTTALPAARHDHPAVVYNDYVYAIGGRDSGDAATSSVLFAPINSTGSLGSWSSATAFPAARYFYPAVVNSGFLYAIGGFDSGATVTSSVLFAPINASGSLGAWSNTTALPLARAEHPAVVNNGYVYVIGGYGGAVATTSVLYSSLSSRNTYWGLTVPGATAGGTYTGTNTFTAVFEP